MGALDLSVQVLNISPRATKEDLTVFFSYCGTIDEIQPQRNGDESQVAIVTFRQPYAFQTALLLNDAIIVDQRVRILPLENGSVPVILGGSEKKQNEEFEGFIPAIQSAGLAAMSEVTDQVSDMGKTLSNQANTVISAAEETLGSIGSVISNGGCCFTRKTLWLSNMLHRTSKSTVQLGNAKARNPNSRKQK